MSPARPRKAATAKPAPVAELAPSSVSRVVRSTGQGTVGYTLVEAFASFVPLTARQEGALVAVVAVAISAVQNYLEHRGTIPTLALLKRKEKAAAPAEVIDLGD